MLMDSQLTELCSLITQIHKMGPSGEHLVDLSLDLPGMNSISGKILLNWKCDTLRYNNESVYGMVIKLEKVIKNLKK